MYYIFILLFNILPIITTASLNKEVGSIGSTIINELPNLVKYLPPDLRGMNKGDAGRICIVAGAVQHSGAPYFSAITALKVGADNAYVITPNETSPIVKSYSPDPLVYPYFNTDTISKITPIIKVSDVIVIGPGLGRKEETITLIYDVINICKTFEKPLVIDADGLIALSENPTILKDYPGPVILTPNHREVDRLIEGVALINDSEENWYDYWGSNITVLMKGETDRFHSNNVAFNWASNDGGSLRRCPGQGDVLAGALGTSLNWALKNKACIDKQNYPQLSQSVAAYAAAKLTRYSNSRAFEQYGRNMLTSDMINNLHLAYKDVFD